MSTWKKVLLEDANVSVGTIATSGLTDIATDLSASNHGSVELVVVDSGELKTVTADFDTGAFNPTTTDTNTMGSGFTVSATTDTTPTTITENDDLFFAAGTGITCETTADGTVTITSTVTNTDEDVSDTNLRNALAALDNADGDLNIGDANDDLNVIIRGNLQVDGTTTTVNSTTLEVDDINIVVASGAANAGAANGAGITVDVDADAGYSVNPELQWLSTHSNFSEWAMKKGGGESTAYIAAMMEESSYANLNGTTPGVGTFGMVGGVLYVQTA